MAHHRHIAAALVLQGLQLFGRGRRLLHQAVIGAVLGFGNQRHDVMQESALGLDHLGDFFQVLVVDAGIITELTFTRMPREVSISRPLLLFDQNPRRFHPAQPAVLPVNPRVDLGAVSGSTQLMVMVTWSMLCLAISSTCSGRVRPLVDRHSF